ncbi:MAG: hypothetical protein Q4A17_03605 [Thermoguttaceae bacterium]|nr:hypothetical protein [Thermoguttaceae bacterium]
MKSTFVNSVIHPRRRVFISCGLALCTMLCMVGGAAADVVSYFNFDSGNYVNSQLTPTVSGNPTTISGKYGEGMDFAFDDRWTFTGEQLANFLSSLDQTCTISFWANVKSDTRSDTGYKVRNAFWLSNDVTFNDSKADNRNMFAHFAYQNGNAYFDSGTANNGYDRINKVYNADSDYPVGEWVHWTYVKDATAGTMRVYRNGVEWMAGSGKTRSVSGIVGMTIANQLSVQMDDFVVDNKALTSGEILNLATSQTALVSDTMNRSLSNASMEISPGGIGSVGTMRFIQQENMAYGRGEYALQSSTTNGGVASRAVDGNTNTGWAGGSMIHTDYNDNEWWQVQFADSAVPVDKVTIWNRTDTGSTNRLGNFTMNFYLEDPSVNASASPVYTYTYSGTFPGTGTIDLPETFNANWVRITNGVKQPLNISEVQIYSPTDNGGFSAASNNGAVIDGKQYQSYNLTLSDNSVLTMDVNGTEKDKLSVSGALNMGGTLKLNFINASAFTAADVSNLLSANSFVGNFDRIEFAGSDVQTFLNSNVVIRSVPGENLKAEEMIHWISTPQDKNFANVNNWSSNPINQNVAAGLYAGEAANMTLNTSMSLGYLHLGYSGSAGETSLTLNSGANLSVTEMSAGENAPATFTVESGATFTASGNLQVGHGPGSVGVFNVNGGTVTVNKLRPGVFSGSKGIVNISGGEVTVNTESEIGDAGTGQVTVSGSGKLTFNGPVRIANTGGPNSFINIEENGEMTVRDLFVGQRGTLQGSMTLSDNAKLTVNGNLQIGTDGSSKGSGTMTLKDNASVTVTSSGRPYIGYNAGTSTLNISDNATFTVSSPGLVIGEAGTGVINQTGGTITLNTTAQIYTGDAASGTAILNISGGEFNANNQFVGGTRGKSTINLSGTGVMNLNREFVGAPGYAQSSISVVNQTGGTMNVKAGIQYGLNANQGSGVYNLSDGTLNTTTIKRLASSTNLNAQFNLSGGAVNADTIAIPLHMTGGTLNVKTIDTTITTTDTFQQSGGVVTVGGTGTIGTTTITGNYLAATQLGEANIARTGTAFQDSNYNNTYLPSLAADGNYNDSNFSHTGTSNVAHYWGVSYNEDVNFGKVVIFNRNFSGIDVRLTDGVGFYVDVLDADDNVVWQSQTYKGGGHKGFTVDVPYDVTGQKIRVVRGAATADPLNLTEVEVYSYNLAADVTNLPTLKFEISSADNYDQLVAQGPSFNVGSDLAVLDVTVLDLDVLNVPKGSTTEFQLFDLADNVDISGEFADILLPELDNGATWDLSRLYTDGVIALLGEPFSPNEIPEPATWALLLLGAFSLLCWRKK